MALSQGKYPQFETVVSKRNIVSVAGATKTLSEDESGALVNIAVVATTITLPLAVPGLFYDFVSTVASTSSQKIITGAASELLIGSVIGEDIDTGSVLVGWPAEAASSYIAVIMNGTTSGGLIGTRLRFTCLSATRWLVEGVNRGNGTVGTLFSAS